MRPLRLFRSTLRARRRQRPSANQPRTKRLTRRRSRSPGVDFAFSAQLYDLAYRNVIGEAMVTKIDGGWEFDPGRDGAAIVELFGNGDGADVIVSFAIE